MCKKINKLLFLFRVIVNNKLLYVINILNVNVINMFKLM